MLLFVYLSVQKYMPPSSSKLFLAEIIFPLWVSFFSVGLLKLVIQFYYGFIVHVQELYDVFSRVFCDGPEVVNYERVFLF